jgi:hypothetical protein
MSLDRDHRDPDPEYILRSAVNNANTIGPTTASRLVRVIDEYKASLAQKEAELAEIKKDHAVGKCIYERRADEAEASLAELRGVAGEMEKALQVILDGVDEYGDDEKEGEYRGGYFDSDERAGMEAALSAFRAAGNP